MGVSVVDIESRKTCTVSVIYIQDLHKAERTTFEEEKRKKDKIGRC